MIPHRDTVNASRVDGYAYVGLSRGGSLFKNENEVTTLWSVAGLHDPCFNQFIHLIINLIQVGSWVGLEGFSKRLSITRIDAACNEISKA
jgi:hypothetical protein